MLHPRIKRELLRSIGIFGFAMFIFLFICYDLGGYYWLIFAGPSAVVIIYMTAVIIWVRRKGALLDENIILRSHRTMVGSVIFIIFIAFALPYLVFKTEFNQFLRFIFVILIFCLGLSIFLFFSKNKQIEDAAKNNKKLLLILRKFAIYEVLVGAVFVYILGLCVIAMPQFSLWMSLIVAIPTALCIELLYKKIGYKINETEKKDKEEKMF